MDRAAFGGDRHKVVGQLPQPLFLAFPRQIDAVTHRLLVQRRPVFHQGHHALHRVNGRRHAFFLAGELERRPAAHRRYAELILQQTNILVTVSENGSCQFDAVQFH